MVVVVVGVVVVMVCSAHSLELHWLSYHSQWVTQLACRVWVSGVPPIIIAIAVVAVVVSGRCDLELHNLHCGLPATAIVGGSCGSDLHQWHAPHHCCHHHGCRLCHWHGGGGGWQCMQLGAVLADSEPPWLVGHAARVCISIIGMVLVELVVHTAQSWVADCPSLQLLVDHAAWACIGSMPIVVTITVVAGFILTTSE